MNFISIGGWCGTKIALKDLGLFNEPSLPFDSVRSSIEGVINCIENDFINYFPKEIIKDNRFPNWIGFVGKYIGFFHHNHNLLDVNVVESFRRKIIRFDEKIKKNNVCFVRTVARDNYNDEIKYYKLLQSALDKKYPNISYIICFIINGQDTTNYYKNLDERTFLFTLKPIASLEHIKIEYKPIFDFIIKNNLFKNIPPPNNLKVFERPSGVWLVDGHPMVNYLEK